MSCFRCGRYGHFADECYAKSRVHVDYGCRKRIRDDVICFRCGRDGHVAPDCYARSMANGVLINQVEKKTKTVICFRCGREGHVAPECYARSMANGAFLETTTGAVSMPRAGVYVVIAVPSAIFYVGKSSDIDRRIAEHKAGDGAACIAGDSVVEVPPITSGSCSDLESWERTETLTLMKIHGIRKVRGWMFVSKELSKGDMDAAFRQICEKFDLCRACGCESHLVADCYSTCKAPWAE